MLDQKAMDCWMSAKRRLMIRMRNWLRWSLWRRSTIRRKARRKKSAVARKKERKPKKVTAERPRYSAGGRGFKSPLARTESSSVFLVNRALLLKAMGSMVYAYQCRAPLWFK